MFGLIGAEGLLFTPLAWSKTLAMIGAVVVALFLVPALSLIFLRGDLKPIDKNPISIKIIDIYRPLLSWVLDHRKTFLIFPMHF